MTQIKKKPHKLELVRAKVLAFGQEHEADAYQCAACGVLEPKPESYIPPLNDCDGIRRKAAFPKAKKR